MCVLVRMCTFVSFRLRQVHADDAKRKTLHICRQKPPNKEFRNPATRHTRTHLCISDCRPALFRVRHLPYHHAYIRTHTCIHTYIPCIHSLPPPPLPSHTHISACMHLTYTHTRTQNFTFLGSPESGSSENRRAYIPPHKPSTSALLIGFFCASPEHSSNALTTSSRPCAIRMCKWHQQAECDINLQVTRFSLSLSLSLSLARSLSHSCNRYRVQTSHQHQLASWQTLPAASRQKLPTSHASAERSPVRVCLCSHIYFFSGTCHYRGQ